jgi:hypothetical protein
MESHIETIRRKEMEQFYRNWTFVSSEQLFTVKVTSMRDEMGSFYISDTRYFVPFWISEDPVLLPDTEKLPMDRQPLALAPENRCESNVEYCCGPRPDDTLDRDYHLDPLELVRVVNTENDDEIDGHLPNSTMKRHIPASIADLFANLSTISDKSPNITMVDDLENLSPTNNMLICANMSFMHSNQEHQEYCLRGRATLNNTKDSNPPFQISTMIDPGTPAINRAHNWSMTDDDDSSNGVINRSMTNGKDCSNIFSSKINGIDFSSIMTKYTNEDINDPGTTVSDQNGTVEQATIEDFKMIRVFLNDVIFYDEYKELMRSREDDLKNMLKDAAEKCVAERINLDAKGELRNPRMLQMLKRYSINSIRISEEARKACDKYNFHAGKYNQERIVQKPIMPPEILAPLRRVLQGNYDAEPFRKVEFKNFETGNHLRETSLYKQITSAQDVDIIT